MRVKVTRLDPTVTLPLYSTAGAAAFDLAAAEGVVIQPGEVRLVKTGLVIAVPAGYCLAVFARSSTPLKRGLMLANGVGIIDSDYCGPTDEVQLPLINISAEPVAVQRGDRLAQGIVLASPRVEWEEVAEIGSASRGGFGSTG